MAYLHEILAVDQSLEGSARTLVQETSRTLDNKEHLFKGHLKVHSLLREDDSETAKQADDSVEVTSTVSEVLEYMSAAVAKHYDVVLQKDSANCLAKADVLIDGEVLLKDIPATTLLGLESKLKSLREVYNKIPTLAPGQKWIVDNTSTKAGVYVTVNIEERFQTKSERDFKIIAEATENHKAQVAELTRTVNVGKFETTHYSGAMSPVDKAAIISRLDNVLHAVKTARMRANMVKVPQVSMGEVLMNFIQKG